MLLVSDVVAKRMDHISHGKESVEVGRDTVHTATTTTRKRTRTTTTTTTTTPQKHATHKHHQQIPTHLEEGGRGNPPMYTSPTPHAAASALTPIDPPLYAQPRRKHKHTESIPTACASDEEAYFYIEHVEDTHFKKPARWSYHVTKQGEPP